MDNEWGGEGDWVGLGGEGMSFSPEFFGGKSVHFWPF